MLYGFHFVHRVVYVAKPWKNIETHYLFTILLSLPIDWVICNEQYGLPEPSF